MNTRMQFAQAMLPSEDPLWIEFARNAVIEAVSSGVVKTVDAKYGNGLTTYTIVMDKS